MTAAERAEKRVSKDVPDLKVCNKCGWHDIQFSHRRECDPVRGAAADRLISLAGVPATKLGYGFGRVTFLFDEEHSVTLSVNADGSFDVQKVFWLGDQTREAAADLIRALAALVTT